MGLKVTEKDLNSSVSFANMVVNNLKRLETNLGWSDIKVKGGTPSHGMFISFGPEREAVRRGKDALVALKASVQLLNHLCHTHTINRIECARFITKFKFDKTPLRPSCARLITPCPQEDYLSPYRSMDGSCNHVSNGILGEAFTGYTRLMYPDYLDGIHEPRRALSKRPLPGPRMVSMALVKHTDDLDDRFTLAVMQWGQFVEHDLSRVATAIMVHSEDPIECCSAEGNNLSPRYVHPFCSPVSIPSNDTYYSSQGLSCMNYVRSLPALRADCSFGPSDQLNQATHYLDGSQIYGSSIRKATALRSFFMGKLEVSTLNNKTYLPLSQSPEEDCEVDSPQASCFISGDARVNFQPQLTAMHTLWYREHNRVAEGLAVENTEWDDETLFQEARRIVIAEMQHITYDEWLEKVLARKYVTKIQNFGDFYEKEDASVSNGFATAAIRALKSLYTTKIQLFKENRLVNDSITLQHYFHKPELIPRPGFMDALIRGLATQRSQKVDIHYAEDLINRLYTNGHFGFDVLSIDIQRGRDHGLPGYNDYRKLCSLSDARQFRDFKDVMTEEHYVALSTVYSSPKDVDLIIGGLMENAVEGSLLGPTFSCLVADQFLRTRKGDRYFYTNENQPKPFSMSQLVEIRKVTLARIFCDNADNITMMQPNVFEKISASNTLVNCNDMPRLDLAMWRDSRDRYFT